MSENINSEVKLKLTIQINNLITIYEQKAECGIFFILEPEKSPLEILGVLNFLKDRIKRWGNTSLFSYRGTLFRRGDILVVGARHLEEAISIIMYMYLSNVVDNKDALNYLIAKLSSSDDLEIFLRNQVCDNIKKGYPDNRDLESKIIQHIDEIILN